MHACERICCLCFFSFKHTHTNCVYLEINKCLFCLMSNFGNDMWKLREREKERRRKWDEAEKWETERESERKNGAADCVQINNNRCGKSQEKGWHVTLFYIDIKHANVDNVNDTISMRIRYQWLSMCTQTHRINALQHIYVERLFIDAEKSISNSSDSHCLKYICDH